MTARRAAAIASAAAVAAAVVLLSTGGSETRRSARPAVPAGPATALSPVKHPGGVIVDCSKRSEASFPEAFADSRNLLVGPLVLVGAAAYTPASVVRSFGGNKFPLLVKAGHSVTVRLAREVQGSAGLAYAGLGKRPLPQRQPVTVRDAADTMRFIACPPGGQSGSHADSEEVTFWSGFVLTRTPGCVPLEVYVDDDHSPRQVALALGARCPDRAIAKTPCDAGGAGTTDVDQKRDVVVGPLVLLGARQTVWHRPDAFNRHGYKIPVTLPEGTTATLSVPQRLTRRVGLIFSHRTQDRVRRLGVTGADTAVRFTACQPAVEPARTGWPGGLVVDRRRCVTLVVTVPGAASVSRRVPLGRRC